MKPRADFARFTAGEGELLLSQLYSGIKIRIQNINYEVQNDIDKGNYRCGCKHDRRVKHSGGVCSKICEARNFECCFDKH